MDSNPEPQIDAHKQKQKVFLLYTLFLGDAVKTGHALGLPPSAITAVAQAEDWDSKISDLSKLRNSDKPGDLERALNRAVNYVQAHTMREQLERVLDEIRTWDRERLRDLLIVEVTDKVGRTTYHLSCRPFADLASAMEKAHALSYLALTDTAQDRARRKEDSSDGIIAATALHTQIASAMANIPLESPEGKLLEGQQKLADDLVDLNQLSLDFTGTPLSEARGSKKDLGEDTDPPLNLTVPE